MRPDNLLIAGASNNGKTAIARRFLCGTQASEEPAAAHSTIPAALIRAPNGPRISHLLAAIRAALGQPPGRRETIAQQRAKTYRAMRAVGLRMLLINDLHDIRGGEGLASMLVQLREIGAVLGMSLGCFATREIAAVLRQDDQLANRLELMTLPRWQIEDPDYWQLLHTFGRRLPLRDAANLTDPDLAAAILARADGLIGAVTRLFRHAAVETARTGQERIDRAMLDRVRTELPAMIESLATSERF